MLIYQKIILNKIESQVIQIMADRLNKMNNSLINEKNLPFKVRKATKEQLKIVYNDWLAGEEWVIGDNDWEDLYEADPDGHFVIETNNKIVAHYFATKCERNFAFLSNFYILPEYRGGNLSKMLIETAKKYLKGYNLGGDGMVNIVPFYEKMLGGKVFCTLNCYMIPGCEKKQPSEKIVDLKQIQFQHILEYERSCVPGIRKQALKLWISHTKAVSIGYVVDGKLRGFGVLRPAKKIFRVGPLLADSPQIAEELFQCMQSYAGVQRSIYYPAYGKNQHSDKMILSKGGKRIFECYRMYNNGEPEGMKAQKVFAVFTC